MQGSQDEQRQQQQCLQESLQDLKVAVQGQDILFQAHLPPLIEPSTKSISDNEREQEERDRHPHHASPPPIPSSLSSPSPSPLLSTLQGLQEHISTIDSSLLPLNWPKHVRFLQDYEYHPSIPQSTLDLVQGKRKRKEKGASDRADGQGDKEEEEEEQGEEIRDEFELEYDEIPIGHAVPGQLAWNAFGHTSTTAIPANETSSAAASISVSTSSTSAFPSAPPLTDPVKPSPFNTNTNNHPPRPLYEIRLITSPPSHPVLNSYGLFATTLLLPGTHLLDYISLVAPDAQADPDSDHTIYLSNDLNLDASISGNQGRFVNDFRGIRTQEQGPNVGWDLYRDAETGQIRMGCKVLKRIRKGEEILCTYGKAYWKSRGVPVSGAEWEDGWDTDLEDTGLEEEGEEKEEEKDGSGRAQ